MNVKATLLASPLCCPACQGTVDVKSRHVAVTGSAIRVYCSADCLRAGDAKPAEPPAVIEPAPRSRRIWWIASGIVVGTTCLVTLYGGGGNDNATAEVAAAPSIALSPPAPPPPPPPPAEDPEREADRALVAELMKDAWIHPLAGPARRMPISHSAAFGAVREGVRQPECVSGHCGVDLGGSIWGEPIHAVHEGVVDWVNRGPNEERGGVFVKLAHRNGTLFTWYFHLAAVPRWIRPGAKVSAGQVIGLLGDTGVKHSGPHLHFAMTVKPSKSDRERYLDPEPLVAIWPLWNPTEKKISTAEPGLPVRAPPRRRPKKKAPKVETTTAEAPAAEPATSSAPEPPPPPSADLVQSP